jgi:hypothetical protein
MPIKAMVKSSGKTATSKTKSNMGLKNPIGPQTKKEAKVKAIPPYTQSKSVEVKAEKKKSRKPKLSLMPSLDLQLSRSMSW